MTRMVMISGIAFAALIGSMTASAAKPHDVRIELKLEVLPAIHVPTGCISSVEYDDGSFVRAFITDPLCLPTGVAKRFIPSTALDFYALDPQQVSIISR